MQLTIRPSTFKDASALNDLRARAFAPHRNIYRPTHPAPQPPVDASPLTELVALLDQKIVATVKYRTQSNRLHLLALAVDPDHQRRGIARQLLDYLAQIARSQNLPELSLYTIHETGNLSIFHSLGFTLLESLPASNLESSTGRPLTESLLTRPT